MISKQLLITVPKTILSILWLVGEGTIKSFFPHPYSHLFCSHKHKHNFYDSAAKLRKKGILKVKNGVYRLTPIGKEKAFFAHLEITLKSINKKKKPWDGFWRVIIFDIPEKKRSLRDDFRTILKILDYKELQKSIWISPYIVPKIVYEMIDNGKLERYIRIITANNIETDLDLKSKFKLR